MVNTFHVVTVSCGLPRFVRLVAVCRDCVFCTYPLLMDLKAWGQLAAVASVEILFHKHMAEGKEEFLWTSVLVQGTCSLWDQPLVNLATGTTVPPLQGPSLLPPKLLWQRSFGLWQQRGCSSLSCIVNPFAMNIKTVQKQWRGDTVQPVKVTDGSTITHPSRLPPLTIQQCCRIFYGLRSWLPNKPNNRKMTT